MAQDDKEKKVTDSEHVDSKKQQEETVQHEEQHEASLDEQQEIKTEPEPALETKEDDPTEEKVEEAGAEEIVAAESEPDKKEDEDQAVPQAETIVDDKKSSDKEGESVTVGEEESGEKEDEDQAVPQAEAIVEDRELSDKESEGKTVGEERPEENKEVVSDEVAKEEGEEEEDDYDDHHLDYSNHTKTQLVQVLASEYKDSDMAQLAKILKEIKPAFDELYHEDREKALKKFLDEGGDKDGFEYKNDDLDERFFKAYNDLKEKKNSFFDNQEKQKDKNFQQKQTILEKLRTIVDSDETVASLKELKDIQEEWKNTGPVAPQHLKSLWANYNALIDRYYDQRSIYFELKELDRKKNLESKIELCEKAEALEGEENIKEAIKLLNELHEEFKHIGPVPKEDQESLWKRFKTASDAVYSKRKEFFDRLKEDLKINQVAKEALAEKVQVFSEFKSDRISEWNQKTKEILEVQREWEVIGGLPRDVAKEINKRFWSAFKVFFNRKGQFFKQIEKARHENLKIKEELVKKAEELKDNDDFQKTAEVLKGLQKEWKDVGPVPEKHRNEIYGRFKAACDHFFNRRRSNDNKQEKEFVINLKKKQELCDEIEAMISKKEVDVERLEEIIEGWSDIGYVPRNEIKNIQQRFVTVVSKAAEVSDLDEEDVQHLKFSAQFNKLKQGPNSNRIIQKKENSLRRQIAKLENDIDLWKNNLSFFAESKTADKLKSEFNEKIDKASRELQLLEEQLRAISNL